MSDSTSRPARLLALGATAVVAIYAAGFDRTRIAARRLAEEDAAHGRPPVEVRNAIPARSDEPTVAAVAAAPAPAAPVVSASGPGASVEARSVPKPATSAAAQARGDTVAAVAAPVPTAPAKSDSAVPSPIDSAPPSPTDTATAVAPVAKWQDGTFTGWGNSRHGSIEATVTIKDGKIVNAYISRCQTRYSCSWIEHLQIQVVDRQGPEVDFVSGATQSVNAFYYAVVDALAKAK
ncbi:MAG: FMN-binding protein [Gemmatimonadetes bacterium]|nr:FMN-binding protein [Gemmatimonadota bacterium]